MNRLLHISQSVPTVGGIRVKRQWVATHEGWIVYAARTRKSLILAINCQQELAIDGETGKLVCKGS